MIVHDCLLYKFRLFDFRKIILLGFSHPLKIDIQIFSFYFIKSMKTLAYIYSK